jgi:transcriptional regulator with XRE-family HTH domain
VLRIELERRNRKLSQVDLGHDPEVRIHQSFISLIELGKGIPTREQAERLARKLGLSPDDLLKPVVVADDVPVVEEQASV